MMEVHPIVMHWMVQHVEVADPFNQKIVKGKMVLETLQSVDYIHYETALKAFNEDETKGVMIRLVLVEQVDGEKFFLGLRQKRIFTDEEHIKQRKRQYLGRILREREEMETADEQ